MAYGVKYRIDYCNKENVNARLDIEIRDYVGVIEHVAGTTDIFTLEHQNENDNKTGYIISTFADINLYEHPITIDAIKTLNETDIRVSYYIADTLRWQGFALPDFFETEITKNAIVSISATDRLSALKEKSLPSENISTDTAQPLIKLIADCLKLTGLSLSIRTATHFDVEGGVGLSTILQETIVNRQRLTDDRGRSISAHDVLRSILIDFNCYLVQRNNEWWIINKYELENGGGKLFKYDANGERTDISYTIFTPNIKDIDLISLGGRRSVQPSAFEVSIYGEYGGRALAPYNYDFNKYTTAPVKFDGWTSYGTTPFLQMVNTRNVIGYNGRLAQFGTETEASSLMYSVDFSALAISFSRYQSLRSEWVPIGDVKTANMKIMLDATTRNNTTIHVGVVIKDTNQKYRTLMIESDVWFENTDYNNLTGQGLGTRFVDESLGATDAVRAIGTYSLPTFDASMIGNINVDTLNGCEVQMWIMGTTDGFVDTFIHSAQIIIEQAGDSPKGTISRVQQVADFSKKYDTPTTIFSDYATGGINGYFYKYPKDDTSVLLHYESANNIQPIGKKWKLNGFTDDYLILQATRQMSRLFASARDVLTIEIDSTDFDILDVYKCGDKRFIATSLSFDFFKGRLQLVLEENVLNNTTKKDFLYSYFGGSDSDNIKSVGGISGGGGGGGTGGGLTPEQIEILSFWKKDPDNPNTIFTEMNAYSTKELSAYGLGSGSGGGGGGSNVEWGATANNYSPLIVEGISKTVALLGHTHTKSEVGLGNVDNVKQLPLSQKGAVGGVAELDENGKVLASQLPSYVDDVLEYANLAGFPTTGETGKIYTALNTNKIYRWSGTTYIEISSSLALGETSSTAYRGDRGKIAYDHSQSAHAPSNAQKNSDITKAEIEAKLTGIITSHSHTVTKADVGLGNVLNVASYSKTETDNLLSSLNVGVTSVGVTAPTGFSVSNSPITSTGNIALAFATGYSLPTTAKQGQWDSAYTDKHTHSNKTVLDGITSTLITNWNDANTKKHTHTNKTIIDQLTQADINVLAKLSLVDGNLKVDTNLYSTGEVSAYGLGSGSGGGGGGGSLVTWGATTNNFVPLTVEGVSKTVALLGHTHTFGSLTSKPTTLSGYGITDAYTKLETNTLLDGKASISALNSKLETSIFNTHNTDNVRHITGAERTKWDEAYDWGDFREFGLGIQQPAQITDGNIQPTINRFTGGSGATATNMPDHYSPILQLSRVNTYSGYILLNRLGTLHWKSWNGVNNPNEWRTAWDNVNFTPDDYVKKSGDTMTGNLTAPTFIGALSGNATTATTATNLSRSILAGNGLTGGGVLNADRTITLGTPSNITLSSTNSVATASHTHNFTLGGTASQYLNGATALVTIPTITAGNGLSGGGQLTASQTLTLGTPSTLDASSTNAVTASSHTHAITTTSVGLANTIVQTDASGGVRGEVIRIGANWTLELVGTELQIKYNGVLKQRFLADGSFVATGEVTAFA